MNVEKEKFPIRIAISLFMIIATFLTYSQVLDYGFLNFDDNKYVTENTHITKGINHEDVVWAFTESYASNWHPITWLSHMFDFEFYGLDPFGHHLTNLLIHIANVILLFCVLMKMTGAVWRSAFVAFLFALHPLNVESVAWIAERKNVLSGFFFFLTLWAYIQYSEKKQFYWLVFLFLALGLMAKPMLVTLPFLLILLDFWPLKRWSLERNEISDSENFRIKPLSRLVIEKIPLFILVIGSSIITYVVQSEGDAVRSTEFRSFYSSTANALVSYVDYLGNMVWPRGLSIFYPHQGDSISGWKTLLCGIFLVLVTTKVFQCVRRVPYLAVGWFWYLGTLVPVIGIVQVGEQAMADRYTYLPMIGIFICIAWGVPDLIRNQKRLSVLAGLYVPFLMVATWMQVKHWENSVTLFEHAIEVNENETPSFVAAYNNLGHALLSEKRYEDAVSIFQRAIEINPDYSKPQNNLGIAFSELKRYGDAIKHFKQAISIQPNYAEAFNNLANALGKIGEQKEAITYYYEAIRLDKDYDEAHFNLGIVLSQQGRIKEAILQYRKALKINSEFTQVHNNLAGLLDQMGDTEGTLFHYKQAITIDPGFAIAHNNLGSTLAQQGKLKEAIPYFERAVEIDPNYIDAQNNLQLARSLSR